MADIARAMHGPIPFSDGTIQIKCFNRDAPSGAPLIFPVELLCNTDDEARQANITANARADVPWLKQVDAHDGTAIICGSGPSIRDHQDEIRKALDAGATLYALNGAAKWLNSIGIVPDFQIILDPRAANIDLIGQADCYLIASQCHPDVLALVRRRATLVHVLWDGLDECLPDYDDDYAVVGSASSVGPVACFIAYTQGFRDLRLYGYDSSHKALGDSHALPQPMNDGEPCAWVKWNGKDYYCSLVMKQQAEQFPSVKCALEQLGCTVDVIGEGLLPDRINCPVEALPEQDKYERMWDMPCYRDYSPAETVVDQIAAFVPPGVRVMDFGCGTARAAVELAKRGYQPVLIDFAFNCRDEEARDLPFVLQDLTEPIVTWAAWGYCCDVMEHIPTNDVNKVLWNISTAADNCFFKIETTPDNMGALIGQTLHLSVYPDAWWLEKLRQYWPDVEAQGNGIFLCRRD